jgi:hypothetical protein
VGAAFPGFGVVVHGRGEGEIKRDSFRSPRREAYRKGKAKPVPF